MRCHLFDYFRSLKENELENKMENRDEALNDSDFDKEIEPIVLVTSRNTVKMKTTPNVLLGRVLLGSAVACAVVNCTVLTITVTIGHWPFGSILCQLYGWLSQILLSTSTWMVALYTLERCCFYSRPTDYPYLLSEINTKLLVCGTILVLVVLHTSPLYGWGEYSQFTGALHFSLVASNTSTMADGASQTVPGVPISSTTALYVLANSSTEPLHVNDVSDASHPLLMHVYVQAIDSVVKKHFECNVRTNSISLYPLNLRCPSVASLERLLMTYANGDLGSLVDAKVTQLVGQADGIFSMNILTNDIAIYQSTFLSIQDVGACTLDWSPVNANVTSWIVIVILVSTCMPYVISISGSLLLMCSSAAFESRDPHLRTHLCHYLCGAFFGLASSVPYYAGGIYSLNSSALNRTYYIIGTVLYFTNTLWFAVCIFCLVILRQNT